MSVSLISCNVDWCDYETFLVFLQHVDVYRSVILMFEYPLASLKKRFLRNSAHFYVVGNSAVARDFFGPDVARKAQPV